MCVLCISNPLVDWHALDPLTPAQAGTGAGGSSNGTSVGFNQNLVNQLDGGSFWHNSNGTVAQTISYGFPTSSSFASGFSEATGWAAFTDAQKTAVRQMMTLWDDLIAPSFAESTGSPNTADIKFSNSTTGVSFAHAYYPGQVSDEASSYDKMEGSVWLNPNYNSGINNLVTPTSGVYGHMAIMHEIGHSLGLDHAGNYNGGSPAYGNTSTGWLYAEDSYQYTIMSYFNANNTGASWGGKYAQTPMVYDIMAIQQMYGADYTTRAGDTIYGFNSNVGNSLYNFSQNTSPILTIWDGNGIDTIDLSGWSSASILNLIAGSYSNVNGMTKNLAIAYDVDIENATVGSGNDTIIGNDLANILRGNGGNDTINGAGGNDTINGGTGVDILTGGTGNDTIFFDSLDNLTLLDGGVGFDTLIQLGVLITFDFTGHNFERLLNIITDLGSAAWSEQTDYYDFGGLYYECDITYDNGTRSVTEYDVYNTEAWSEWTVTYAANGDIMSEVFVPDSGSGSAPSITSNEAGTAAAVNIVENSTVVTTVTATDPDEGAVLAYSVIGGADAAKFTINATTGVLSFVSAPNFEAPTDVGANNIYDVQVRVSDGTLTDTQTISVTVANQNETPTITSNGAGASAAINVAENNTAVTTVAASDPDAGATWTYSIIGGADAAKFTINVTTGVLSFISTQNFEAATDAGANNVYDVQVQVSDSVLTDTQTIAVTVTNQNEAPTITSVDGGASALPAFGATPAAALNVAEGIAAVTTVTASDPDAGAVLTYSITGGADAAKFIINATTGVLRLISAPDFEAPTDVGANNVYDVQVQVSDGTLTDTQAIAVTVTDQDEATIVTFINGTSSSNVLTGKVGIDIIDGLAGNDTLAGLGAADQLIGGVGTDTATYMASAAGVSVSLMTGLGSGGDAEGDTLSTIENLTGSNQNDTFEGNGGNNVLAGGLRH